MTVMQHAIPVPWYRQAWPWFLISLPAAAVIAGSVTWYIAWRTSDGLVTQDYYKQGLEINRAIESQLLAKQLGLSATLGMADGLIRLRLTAEREITPPQTLVLKIISPTREGRDQRVELQRHGETYEGALPDLKPGHWRLSLEDAAETWKILASAVLPLQGDMQMKP